MDMVARDIQELRVNFIVKLSKEEVYTIVLIDEFSSSLWLSKQSKESIKPFKVQFGESIGRYAWDNFTFESGNLSHSELFNSVTGDTEATALKNYGKIEPIVTSGDIDLYIRGNLASATLASYAKDAKVSLPTIYKYLNRFLAFGAHYKALAPRYHECGKHRTLPKDQDAAAKAKNMRGGSFLGRPSLAPEMRHAIEFTQQDKDKLERFIKRDLVRCNDHSFRGLYQEYLRLYCLEQAEDGNGGSEPLPIFDNLISIDQFKYHFRKLVDAIAWNKMLTSPKNHANNNEINKSTAQSRSKGPGDLYEIDSTTLDLYIVTNCHNKENPRVIGRPYIYLVVDVYSGLISGYSIGFKQDAFAAKLALYNAFTNKVEHCEKYGVQISSDDWPSDRICRILVCDRGAEYVKSTLGDFIEQDLGLEGINFTSAYMGKQKGSVEVNFNAINKLLLSKLYGFTYFKAKDAPHSSNSAIYTMHELHQVIIKLILECNRTRLNYSRLNVNDIREGNLATPLEIWRNNIAKQPDIRTGKSKEQVMLAMLNSEEAVVKKGGLKLKSNGLTYISGNQSFMDWQEASLLTKKKTQIQLKVNPQDCRFAWCLWSETNDGDEHFLELRLHDEDKRFSALSYDEIEIQQETESKAQSINRQTRLLDSAIRMAEAKANKPKPPKSSRKGVAQNMKSEWDAAVLQKASEVTDEARRLFGTKNNNEGEPQSINEGIIS